MTTQAIPYSIARAELLLDVSIEREDLEPS